MNGMMCPQDNVLEPGSARGKNVCIIGGTGGLGQALALKMAADGANVTVVGRTFRDAGTKNLLFMKARRSTARCGAPQQHTTRGCGRGATSHPSRRRTSRW